MKALVRDRRLGCAFHSAHLETGLIQSHRHDWLCDSFITGHHWPGVQQERVALWEGSLVALVIRRLTATESRLATYQALFCLLPNKGHSPSCAAPAVGRAMEPPGTSAPHTVVRLG